MTTTATTATATTTTTTTTAAAPFPVKFAQAADVVQGVHTDVAVLGFTNRIVVIVTQLSNIASIITCQLPQPARVAAMASAALSAPGQNADVDTNTIATRFLLGHGIDDRTMLNEIYATHLTAEIAGAALNDTRPVLCAISLKPRDPDSAADAVEFDDETEGEAVTEDTQEQLSLTHITRLVLDCFKQL
ncbi:hypothetical protein GQ42DRAFT_164039 [Ramicandelaber brevisporus]|nr:hypothetical protein GQ42DRAFT_164039 [Ramicandelaber brevisporus]